MPGLRRVRVRGRDGARQPAGHGLPRMWRDMAGRRRCGREAPQQGAAGREPADAVLDRRAAAARHLHRYRRQGLEGQDRGRLLARAAAPAAAADDRRGGRLGLLPRRLLRRAARPRSPRFPISPASMRRSACRSISTGSRSRTSRRSAAQHLRRLARHGPRDAHAISARAARPMPPLVAALGDSGAPLGAFAPPAKTIGAGQSIAVLLDLGARAGQRADGRASLRSGAARRSPSVGAAQLAQE